jgi:hypothetical protein
LWMNWQHTLTPIIGNDLEVGLYLHGGTRAGEPTRHSGIQLDLRHENGLAIVITLASYEPFVISLYIFPVS